HAAVLDFDAADIRYGGRAGIRVRSGCGRGALWRAEILPVARTRRIFDQAQIETIDLDPADLEFLVEQRQQLDAKGDVLHCREWLWAETGRIAQAGGSQLQCNPGEYGQLDRTGERELAAGGASDFLRDAVLVVVRIDEQPHAQQHD